MRARLECRLADDGRRYMSGLVVPWNQEIVYRGRPEMFLPGSVRVPDRVPLRWHHLGQAAAATVPVGVLVEARDTDAGLWGEFRLSASPTATEVYAAVEIGAVRGLSIEFERPPGSPPGGQGVVRDVELRAVALVEEPAYESAQITHLRMRTPRADDLARWLEARKA